MSKSSVRFGLIGIGAWGKFHAESISKTEGAELAAISDCSEESCRAAREAHPQAAIYTDYRELLQRDDLDVVDVTLPSHLHRDVGCAVLRSGKHLLMEKPMAISTAECDDLLQTARKQGKLLAVDHQMRLSSLWGKVKELIDSGLVGRPQYVLVELSRNPYRLGSDGWRFDIDRVGNWILEEPIHFFDLARWYLAACGEPTTLYAVANSRQPDHPELQDNFSTVVNFPDGAYAVLTQTLSAFEHHQTVKVTGTAGAVWAGWSGAMDRTRHPTYFLKAFDGEKVEQLPITRVPGELFELEDQMAMLVRAVREGADVSCTGEDGKWAVAMCLAAQHAVDRGEPVKLDEFVSSDEFV